MPHCFVTIRDPASHLAGWVDVLDPAAKNPALFERFVRFVWNQGRRDGHGSWVYDNERERDEDIDCMVDPLTDKPDLEAQGKARQTPTFDELGRRFIREELNEDPVEYGL